VSAEALFFLEFREEIEAQLRFLNAQGNKLRIGRHTRHPASYLAAVEEIRQGADDEQAHQHRDFDPLFRHIKS
jgi:hypothetical protein